MSSLDFVVCTVPGEEMRHVIRQRGINPLLNQELPCLLVHRTRDVVVRLPPQKTRTQDGVNRIDSQRSMAYYVAEFQTNT